MKRKQPHFGFSALALMAAVAAVQAGFGGWSAYVKHRVQGLCELRNQGAIVIVRDRTPRALRAIGISRMSPFFDVPTVELYVTPRGNEASVGNSETLTSIDVARKTILEQASYARDFGAGDVQLIQIDSFDRQWFAFAEANSLASIEDSKHRYLKRLKANQESGANINP